MPFSVVMSIFSEADAADMVFCLLFCHQKSKSHRGLSGTKILGYAMTKSKKDTQRCLMLFYVHASLEQSVKFCINLVDYSAKVFGLVGKVKVVDINN